MKKVWLAAVMAGASFAPAARAAVVFDFDSAPLHASLPLQLTVEGITANLSASDQGMSIQRPTDSIGLTPAGFSGYCISPNSVFRSDLTVSFDQSLTDFSILFAPQELACDSSATMLLTAYQDATIVGTTTAVAPNPGTWPTGTLAFSAAGGFNKFVIHYQSPPPTGGDYGVIFVADNMQVTALPVGVPEAGTLGVLGIGVLVLVRKR